MEELLDFLRANAALMVSALAVLLTAYSVWATRRHNRLMVQPRLSAWSDTHQDRATNVTVFEVKLRNSGLGPAFIQKFEVTLDDTPLKVTTPDDLFARVSEAVPANYTPDPRYCSVLRKGYVMAKDAEIRVVHLGIEQATPAQHEQLKRFNLRITFESAYGDLYVYDTRVHTAERPELGELWLALKWSWRALKAYAKSLLPETQRKQRQ